MKKFVLVLAAIAALLMSCQPEEKAGSLSGEGYKFNFTITPGGFDSATKGDATVGWTTGEKVYVFFKPEGGELLGDSYAAFTYTGSGWTPESYVAAGALGSSGKMAAVYVPYFDGKSPVYTDSKWTFDSGDVYYSCASGADYTVEDGTVRGTLSMKIPDGYVQLAVASAAEGDELACNMIDGYEDVTLSSDLVFSTTPVSGSKMTGHADNGKIYFWGMVNGATATECEFTLTTEDGDAIVTVPAEKVFKNAAFSLTTLDAALAVEFVEIGGVRWASMNLGATTVAGSLATCAGDYYQWGSVNTLYESISWTETPSATWKTDSESGYVVESIVYSGNDAILPDANDAVRAALGNGWRMPTSAEFQALYSACGGSYDKTTYASVDLGEESIVPKGIYWCGNYDGVAGCLFCDGTSKLFFPAAGYFNGTDILVAGAGSDYWSGELNAGTNMPYCWAFDANDVYPQIDNERHYGFSVRPVKAVAPALPAGALTGVFSVSATKKVYFSQGNLIATVDATGAPTAWKFASNQYDCLGEGGANKTIGVTAGDVDLFGWSTESTNYGISASKKVDDYPGDFVDWGKAYCASNSIAEGTWRTLSKDEWGYLLNTRTVNGGTEAGKSYSINITYGGKNGMVLYPDNYTGSALSGTVETLPDGVVFLPAAGSREGSVISAVGSQGFYCSSTGCYLLNRYPMHFGSSYIRYDEDTPRKYGSSVRLVTDVK